MFGRRFWGGRYFAPRYFGSGGAITPRLATGTRPGGLQGSGIDRSNSQSVASRQGLQSPAAERTNTQSNSAVRRNTQTATRRNVQNPNVLKGR